MLDRRRRKILEDAGFELDDRSDIQVHEQYARERRVKKIRQPTDD